MTGGDRPGSDRVGHGRRLTLTPISFDIVVALGQLPEGLRLSPLAHAIGSPVSSVQAALRILVSARLAERVDATPPHYRLNRASPALDHLLGLSLVQPEPAHVVAILLRASPAVTFAVVDGGGFVAGVAQEDGGRADAPEGLLSGALDTIRASRDDVPPVELVEHEELARLLAVSVGLRSRIRDAIVLKGRLPTARTKRIVPEEAGARQPVR